MNDELSGQLTTNWRIPPYAQSCLWLESENEIVKVEGEYGLFNLNYPSQMLTLRWGGTAGPALARLQWQADTLEWDGRIATGGYLDAIYVADQKREDTLMLLLYLGGYPLKQHYTPHPNAAQRGDLPYTKPDFHGGLASDMAESITTWLVQENSTLASICQDAITRNIRLYLFGSLANEDSGWGKHYALPLLLEGLTLFPT